MTTVASGQSFDMFSQNFFEGFFDRAGGQYTTQLNNPGSFGSFALDDTITGTFSSRRFSGVQIENYTGLTVDAGNVPTAGVLTAAFGTLTTLATGVTEVALSIIGLNWNVTDILQAALTISNADDLALIASAFDGNDRFDLSDSRDAVRGFNGRDKIFGNGGNDRLLGDGGADLVKGGAGNDQIKGGGGADTLTGGTGDDTLGGDGGADLFQFAIGDGADSITDFSNGLDRIDILSGATGFAGVTVTASGGGLDTVLQFGGVTVTLLNVSSTQIDASDFLFH